MKQAYEYFDLSCGAGASDIKATCKRRDWRTHSFKVGFDDAFWETLSNYAQLMRHALVASKTRASFGSKMSASSCSPEIFRWSLMKLRLALLSAA